MPLFDENELKHYGVPGMKWGVRKAKEGAKNPQKVLVSVVKHLFTKPAPPANPASSKSIKETLKELSNDPVTNLAIFHALQFIGNVAAQGIWED